MFRISYRTLNLLSTSWIATGIVIFLLGWCRWYYSVPLTVAIIASIVRTTNKTNDGYVEITHRKFWIALLIVFIITALCGIGGYVVQSNDNYWRNAMFRDLVNYSWPVYDDVTNLTKSYYIAFWMLPAAISKLFNSIEIGFLSQLIWLSVGFHLLYLQICRYMGKPRLSYIFFFYLFAGLKVVECLIYLPIFGDGNTISETVNILFTNASPGNFHAGPMSQLLYDPFNQTIPLFLGMMLMINEPRGRHIPFTFSLLLLYAPFPLVGLAPLALYWFVGNISKSEYENKLAYIFSFENIVALIVLIISALYLMSNENSGHKGLRPIANLSADIVGYLLYICFEFGILMVIGYKACKDKTVLWIAFFSVCIFAWFQIGLHNDFCFRTNMPFIFILCLLVTRRYYISESSSKLRIGIVVWYILAGIPAQFHPCLRWLSSYCILADIPQEKLNEYQHFKDVREMYVMRQTKMRNDELQSSFRCKPEWNEFRTDVGSPDAFFFKYIAKKVK